MQEEELLLVRLLLAPCPDSDSAVAIGEESQEGWKQRDLGSQQLA